MGQDLRRAGRFPERRDPSAQLRALGEHHATLSALLDATTFRHLDRLGVAPGWRCWEAGAGSGTVADWLARRGAQVLATDVDLSFLQPAAYETRQHDVGTQPAPGEAFDLVHARLLLEHVSARDAALQTMAGALRPGGRLLIESADPLLQPLACPDAIGPAEATANQQRQEALAARAERTDLAYGRTLPRRLRDAGLTDVEAEVCFALGGPAAARLQKTLAGEAGKQVYAAFPVVSAWGRYPGGNCPGGASAGE